MFFWYTLQVKLNGQSTQLATLVDHFYVFGGLSYIMDSKETLLMVAVICFLVGLAIISLVIINSNYDKHMMVKVKAEEEEKEQQFQNEINEIKPDSAIGDRNWYILFKDHGIYHDEGIIPLNKTTYFPKRSNNRILLMTPAPYGCLKILNIPENLFDKIIEKLKEYGSTEIQRLLRIEDDDYLRELYDFNGGSAFAYQTDEKSKLFKISGYKKKDYSWKLLSIEFTPHYVTDYEVETVSEENGRISGHAGAALVGGAIGGATGAVIGSSLGNNVSTETVSRSKNSANDREIPSMAILIIKNEEGKEIKVSERLYEDDVVFLKKHFLVDNEKSSKSSVVEEIQKLKDLFDQNIISEEEFTMGKKKLLG